MSDHLPLFVHSKVDEAGLTASQFRVLAHLRRRGDNLTGRCDPSIPEIARVCRMAEKTVKGALKELEGNDVVRAEKRSGRTKTFSIDWGWFDTRVSNRPHPKHTPGTQGITLPGHPLPNIPPEGNPVKVIQIRIPEGLQSPEFLAAWEQWHAYRRERKLKPWTPSTQNLKLRELADMGTPAAVAAINASICNGWASIYPAKGSLTKQTQPHFR